MTATLPTGSLERKDIPMVSGLLDYFPAALATVAEVSKAGNDKHNPGEEMHHARGKSMDHADCILRHLVDRGTVDPEDGLRHSAKTAWRALALLQEELEANGAPLPRGARLPAVTAADFGGETVEAIEPYSLKDPAFGVETDPFGKKYRRTGERRKLRKGDLYINEGSAHCGLVTTALGDCTRERTIVTLVDDAPEDWTVGSVHHFDAYPGDPYAGDWRIVDYRAPKRNEFYVVVSNDETFLPEVLQASGNRARDQQHAIVERIHVDSVGIRYKILGKREIRRGDCYLAERYGLKGKVVGPVKADQTWITRTIVERVE